MSAASEQMWFDNPYRSPAADSFHTHRMPTWLKWFLGIVAGTCFVLASYDLLYMHKITTRYNSEFEGMTYKEVLQKWVARDLYGPPEG